MTPAPGILNRILFQLFVKDLLPVPRTTVDRHVGDGEVMDDLDGLQVIHTPGHCAGQVAFLWPREGGVLFVGDAAANTLGLRLSISYEDLVPRQADAGQACGTSLLGSALRPRKNDRKRGCGEVRAEVGNSLVLNCTS